MLAFLFLAIPTGFAHLNSFVFTKKVTTAGFLPLLHLQFSTKKFSQLLSNRQPCIGNKLTCQWTIAYVWFAVSSLSLTSFCSFHQLPPVPSFFSKEGPFSNRSSLFFPPLIYFLFLSFWLSFSFLNVFFASLLPPSSLYSLFFSLAVG